MNKELLVSFAELSRLSIACGGCKTTVILDCRDMEARIPDECPSCGTEYDASFRTALQKYREVYRRFADPDGRQVEVLIADTEK